MTVNESEHPLAVDHMSHECVRLLAEEWALLDVCITELRHETTLNQRRESGEGTRVTV